MEIITKYFIRINEESIDDTIREYGSIERDGFETREAALGDLETVSGCYDRCDTYEIIEVQVKSVSDKLMFMERNKRE